MTLILAGLVLVANIAFGLASPHLARGLSPQAAARLISPVAFLTTLASGFVLSVLCFDFLAQVPAVAAAEAWSIKSLNVNTHVPLGIGILALVGLMAAAIRAMARVAHVAGELWSGEATNRRLSPVHGNLVVVQDQQPDAYASPGLRGGRVVVTSAMLSALDDDEARVLLAHEASHLRHHHHLYIALAHLAAVNPLMGGVPRVVRLAVERWADEDAACSTGDRRLTARAVARAGLITLQSPRPARPDVALAVADSAVAQRTRALLAPAIRTRPALVGCVLAVVLLTAVASIGVEHQTEHRFEQARAAYLQR